MAETAEKNRLRQREYYLRNKERLLQRNREWRKANPEKVIEMRRRWDKANPERSNLRKLRYSRSQRGRLQKSLYVQKNLERVRAAKRNYAKRNPHHVRAKTAKRRAARRNATVRWDEELTALVTSEMHHKARFMEQLTGVAWHVDHILPLGGKTVCGLHVWNNLQVIPALANMRKSNRLTTIS